MLTKISTQIQHAAQICVWAVVLFLIFVPIISLAHEGETHNEPALELAVGRTIDERLSQTSLGVILYASIIIATLVALATLKKEKSDQFKKALFALILIATLATTIYLTAGTIYVNAISHTKGPVHWHADFRIFACGQELDLKDPRGLSNRIGTPVLHEHGDNRIHVEGVVVEPSHVNLARFFHVVGGRLTTQDMILPTNEGKVHWRNGDLCTDGRPGNWQVFVYQTRDKLVTQTKLTDYPNYVLSPEAVVPPADCIIFEFSPEQKERTDKICNFYQIELNKNNLQLAN